MCIIQKSRNKDNAERLHPQGWLLWNRFPVNPSLLLHTWSCKIKQHNLYEEQWNLHAHMYTQKSTLNKVTKCACLKILHEVLIITTPISIHCFKDLWHCWIKKQFSTSKYNSWKPVFRWGACYGCMGWSWTCYTYTDQTNLVHLGHSDRGGITVKRQFKFGHFWLFWQWREADIYQPTKPKAKPLFPCTWVIRASKVTSMYTV